jgi:hypothetical protein
MTMAACSADLVALSDPGGLVAFGAGFMEAPSADAASHLADQMAAISRHTGLGLVFGIDVGGDGTWAPIAGTPETYLFACDAGRRVLWPGKRLRSGSHGESPSEERVIELCGMRVGVVVDGEVFNAPLRRQLDRERPDVILVVTHAGPNARWKSALEGLAVVGPVVMTGETRGEEQPAWCEAPPGWQQRFLGGTPSMTLVRYWAGHAQHAALSDAAPP